jgi:hypothetical protein
MRNKKAIPFAPPLALIALLALALCGCASPSRAPRASARAFEHPQWGASIHLANNEVEAIIAPERGGRLMHYSRLGAPNLLWTAPDIDSGHGDQWGWRNWGGEKTWLWPQDDWPNVWPPALDVEQAPWHLDGIRETKREKIHWLEIALSAETFAGKMTRTISMPSAGTQLEISATLENNAATTAVSTATNAAAAYSVWSVLQIPVPEIVGANRTEPRRLLLRLPGSDNAIAMRDSGTLDLASTPGGVKGMLDADAFRVPTAQGVLVARQRIDESAESEYKEIYRAQICKSIERDGDAYVELEFAAPLPAAGKLKSRQRVELSLE